MSNFAYDVQCTKLFIISKDMYIYIFISIDACMRRGSVKPRY